MNNKFINNLPCSQCRKLNPPSSNYCQKCGSKLTKDDNPKKDDTSSKKTSNTQQKSKLWDKFAEMYDSSGEKREKYLSSTSDEAWNFLQRVSTNMFEKFIEDNKEELNKQPYRVVESLKSNFNWSAFGGYWIWLAEQIYDNEKIQPLRNYDIEILIQEWEKLVFEDYSKTYESISEQVKEIMYSFFTYRVDSFLNSDPRAKDLTKEWIDKMRASMIYCVIWGYVFGLVEAKYRS